MKTGKGVVKKYSREYNRTLKNGEKKKYTTKQIQITIPKHDDIYEDKEEVLIIPQSEIEEFKNLEDKVSALEIANYIYTNEIETTPKVNVEAFENEINQLKQEKDQLLSTLENESSKLETLKDKHSKLIEENENIKTKFVNINQETENIKTKFVNIKQETENIKTKFTSIKDENKNLKDKCSYIKDENKSIKDSYERISNKYTSLKQDTLNTKTSYANIFESNQNLEKELKSMYDEYNELVDKYNELEEENYFLKSNKSHDEYIANRIKEFILKTD